jgi:hypothetical protein
MLIIDEGAVLTATDLVETTSIPLGNFLEKIVVDFDIVPVVEVEILMANVKKEQLFQNLWGLIVMKTRDSITRNEINTQREANLYQFVAQRFDGCLSSMPLVSQLSCFMERCGKTNQRRGVVDDFDALTKKLTAKYVIGMLTTISWFLVVVDDDVVLTTTDKLEISNNFELKFYCRSSVIARQQNLR